MLNSWDKLKRLNIFEDITFEKKIKTEELDDFLLKNEGANQLNLYKIPKYIETVI